jgi:SAM-dependent methyltransferase
MSHRPDPDEYDPVEYWTNAPPMEIKPAHLRQQAALGGAISHLNPTSILEIGVGWGRIGLMLCDMWPDAAYTGIDISPDRITEASRKLPERAQLYPVDVLNYMPSEQFDLVIAVEVLMHVQPEDLRTVITRMKGWSRRWVYTVDWTAPVDKPVAPWNFRYDYTRYGLTVVGTTGLQSIHRWAREAR